MIKGAIFDLDGTLLATLESIAKAGNEMLKTFGYESVPQKQYGAFAGNGADKLVERALIYSGDTQLSHLEEAIRVYREYFGRYCSYEVRPYDGILTMLSGLVSKNIRLGVVTNKPHNNAVRLMQEYFGDYPFTHVLGQQEGFPQKPDPKGILTVLADWNIAPSECVYLGDSDVDMQTGNNAGCLTVGALWGFRDQKELVENGAHHVISHPTELLSLLED